MQIAMYEKHNFHLFLCSENVHDNLAVNNSKIPTVSFTRRPPVVWRHNSGQRSLVTRDLTYLVGKR